LAGEAVPFTWFFTRPVEIVKEWVANTVQFIVGAPQVIVSVVRELKDVGIRYKQRVYFYKEKRAGIRLVSDCRKRSYGFNDFEKHTASIDQAIETLESATNRFDDDFDVWYHLSHLYFLKHTAHIAFSPKWDDLGSTFQEWHRQHVAALERASELTNVLTTLARLSTSLMVGYLYMASGRKDSSEFQKAIHAGNYALYCNTWALDDFIEFLGEDYGITINYYGERRTLVVTAEK
jgi:hypothetical protein